MTEHQASQSQAAYLALEEMLVTLKLAPGEMLTERDLIGRLSMGRTPVREAVQRLAWEGLLEIRPRAGIAVTPAIASDWIKVIDARRGLEQVLARDAARNLVPDAALAFADGAMAMQDAVANADSEAFLAADKAFDLALAAAAQNDFAARFAAPLQTHSRRFWFRYARRSGLAEAANHHLAVINAILDQDAGAAEAEAARLMALLADAARQAAEVEPAAG